MDPGVAAFIKRTDSSLLYLSVLTLGELRKGVALKRQQDAVTADRLSVWVDGLEYSFADRILGINAEIATLWGEFSAQRPRSVVDTLLAATAIVHGLTLITRNTKDIHDIRVEWLNPFSQ